MSRASEYAANAARILQAKGDAIAQGHLTRGNIIGNTIATLGQVIPQQVQEVMQRNAEKRKTEQIHGILGKYPNDLGAAANEIMAIDRDLGTKLLEQNMQAKKFAMETAKFDDDMKQRKRAMLLKPFQTARNADEWDQARLNAKVAGAEAEIPYVQMEWSDDLPKRVLLDQMPPDKQYDVMYPKPQGLMNLGGGAVMDADTRTMVREAQLTPDQIADNARMSDAETRQSAAQAETVRHNQAVEAISRMTAGRAAAAQAETARHNKAMEAKGDGGAGDVPSTLPPAYQLALRGVTINLPNTRRDNLNTVAKLAYEQGGEKALAEVIRRASVDTEPVAARTMILGRRETLQALDDASVILKQLKDKGVSTNILRGTVEDVARKLGTSTNPELVRLATRLKNTEANYRRSITGAQFGEKEAADYTKMFPNYSNTLPVNLALIEGLKDAMGSYDKAYWTHKLGREGAQLVGVLPGGAAPRGGGSSGAKNDPMGIR